MDAITQEVNVNSPEPDVKLAIVTNEFYVVSIKKFCLLFFTTLGFYSIYWFYKNWLHQKQSNASDGWPAMRGLFYIFFTHSLFRNIDKQLNANGQHHSDLYNTATLVVFATLCARLASSLSDKNIGSPVTDFLCVVLTVSVGVFLIKAQRSINLACNDPDGSSNDTLTWLNIIWIAVGGILTLLTLAGLVMIVTEVR